MPSKTTKAQFIGVLAVGRLFIKSLFRINFIDAAFYRTDENEVFIFPRDFETDGNGDFARLAAIGTVRFRSIDFDEGWRQMTPKRRWG